MIIFFSIFLICVAALVIALYVIDTKIDRCNECNSDMFYDSYLDWYDGYSKPLTDSCKRCGNDKC